MAVSPADHPLKDVLDELVEVRPFPATASQLMAACDDPNVTAGQLSEIISTDPGLAMKLLQVANSPLYGFGGEVRSIQQASVLIGLRALRTLALSMAMGDVFGSGSSTTAGARKQLWNHALATGAIARTIASTINMSAPDEAFLAGVVHDVGKLIFVDHCPDQYLSLQRSTSGRQAVEAEKEVFGLTHTDVGRTCGENWGLPDELGDVISFHHAPDDADFSGELIDVVCAANSLTRIWDSKKHSAKCPSAAEILNAVRIDLSPEEIEQLHHESVAAIAAIRQSGC